MQIAEYETKYAREVVEMWRASFERGVGVTDPHPIEDQLNFFFREVVPNNKVRVVLEESAIVAFMASTPESVSHLYVSVQSIGQRNRV
jgi:hypothetical protein